MKKLLIVYPHWPPSNLAGVHRSRLIANFSREFGWDVTVLTVNESHYEETLDPDLCKLVACTWRSSKRRHGVCQAPWQTTDWGHRHPWLVPSPQTHVGVAPSKDLLRVDSHPLLVHLVAWTRGLEKVWDSVWHRLHRPLGVPTHPIRKALQPSLVCQTSGLDSRTHGDPESGADFGVWPNTTNLRCSEISSRTIDPDH